MPTLRKLVLKGADFDSSQPALDAFAEALTGSLPPTALIVAAVGEKRKTASALTPGELSGLLRTRLRHPFPEEAASALLPLAPVAKLTLSVGAGPGPSGDASKGGSHIITQALATLTAQAPPRVAAAGSLDMVPPRSPEAAAALELRIGPISLVVLRGGPLTEAAIRLALHFISGGPTGARATLRLVRTQRAEAGLAQALVDGILHAGRPVNLVVCRGGGGGKVMGRAGAKAASPRGGKPPQAGVLRTQLAWQLTWEGAAALPAHARDSMINCVRGHGGGPPAETAAEPFTVVA